MATTPLELSKQIGVSEKKIREVLRNLYRPNGDDKNARWALDDAMVAAVRRELGK